VRGDDRLRGDDRVRGDDKGRGDDKWQMIQFTKTNTLNNTEHRQRIHNNNLQETPPPSHKIFPKLKGK
jgi:hypothetical protein